MLAMEQAEVDLKKSFVPKLEAALITHPASCWAIRTARAGMLPSLGGCGRAYGLGLPELRMLNDGNRRARLPIP